MGVVENLKDAAELLQKAGQIELYKKISAAEDEVRELNREKRRLEDKVEELERALKFKDEVQFDPPFYRLKQGDTTPYCANCWEKTRHAVHVVLQFRDTDLTRWTCPACKTDYNIRPNQSSGRHQIADTWNWS